jgi:hypothetical protein
MPVLERRNPLVEDLEFEAVERERDVLQSKMDEVYAALPASSEYMDPPDGGSPSAGVMVGRMRADRDSLRTRVAELETKLEESQLNECAVQRERDASQGERDRLLGEVENILRSASPHPEHHPSMHQAWKQATKTMAELGYPVPIHYLKRAGDTD